MTRPSSVSELLERRSLVAMECTIPGELTIEEWRALRPRRRRSRSARLIAGVRRVMPLRPITCDHICDTTTRYDRAQARLTFLLTCRECGTARVIETLAYEPRFDPTPAPHSPDAPGGATLHELPARVTEWRARRAA
jgi:hypothetical protein